MKNFKKSALSPVLKSKFWFRYAIWLHRQDKLLEFLNSEDTDVETLLQKVKCALEEINAQFIDNYKQQSGQISSEKKKNLRTGNI